MQQNTVALQLTQGVDRERVNVDVSGERIYLTSSGDRWIAYVQILMSNSACVLQISMRGVGSVLTTLFQIIHGCILCMSYVASLEKHA